MPGIPASDSITAWERIKRSTIRSWSVPSRSRYVTFSSYGTSVSLGVRRTLIRPPDFSVAVMSAETLSHGTNPSSGRIPIPSCEAVKLKKVVPGRGASRYRSHRRNSLVSSCKSASASSGGKLN